MLCVCFVVGVEGGGHFWFQYDLCSEVGTGLFFNLLYREL